GPPPILPPLSTCALLGPWQFSQPWLSPGVRAALRKIRPIFVSAKVAKEDSWHSLQVWVPAYVSGTGSTGALELLLVPVRAGVQDTIRTATARKRTPARPAAAYPRPTRGQPMRSPLSWRGVVRPNS